VERLEFEIGDTLAAQWEPSGRTISSRPTIGIPVGEYGDTTVSMRAIDGRGQVTTRSTTVSLPPPTGEDVPENPAGNMDSDETSQGGTSPPASMV